jgi:TPR repeat protein
VTDRITVNGMSATCIAAAAGFLAVTLVAGRLEAQAPRAPAPPRPPAPAAVPAAKPAVAAAPAPPPAARATATPSAHEPDLAYGAYQRGYFLTAFLEATKRVDRDKGDARAMTLLGELYANGLGVSMDEAKAVKWYKLAADRGDRDAMFALAIFHVSRRGGLHDRSEAARLFAAAAKLGHAGAAYDLGLLYLEGQLFPQDFARAAELFKQASQEGNAEAQYALATLYKQGRGVPQDEAEAARLLGLSALADNNDALLEYAIELFNGIPIKDKDGNLVKDKAGNVVREGRDKVKATQLLRKAALRGSPIAQNRLAWLLSVGDGTTLNPVEAIKWHLIAKAGGKGDPELDQWAAKQTPQVRTAAEKAAQPWLIVLQAPRG